MRNKVNEIKVSYKERIPAKFWQKISSSKDAAEVFYENWDKDTIGFRESFQVMLLNNANKVKGIYELSRGGLTGTIVDMRILNGLIFKSLTVGFLLAHNHPSGTRKPSQSDIALTEKIKTAWELFDVKLLDHIILTPYGDYYSFADEGLL